VHHSIYLIAFRQSRVPAVDLVSDPPTQLSTSSRGAKPSSESAASHMLDLLHGTVFHTISIISVILVFSSAASKLNYFVEHTVIVLVSAPGRSVNNAINDCIIIIINIIIIFNHLPDGRPAFCIPDIWSAFQLLRFHFCTFRSFIFLILHFQSLNPFHFLPWRRMLTILAQRALRHALM